MTDPDLAAMPEDETRDSARPTSERPARPEGVEPTLKFSDWLSRNTGDGSSAFERSVAQDPMEKYRGYQKYLRQSLLENGNWSPRLASEVDQRLAQRAIESGDFHIEDGSEPPTIDQVLGKSLPDELPIDSLLDYALRTDGPGSAKVQTAAMVRALKEDPTLAPPDEYASRMASATAAVNEWATPDVIAEALKTEVREGKRVAALIPSTDSDTPPDVFVSDDLMQFVSPEDGSVDDRELARYLKGRNVDPMLIGGIKEKLSRPPGYTAPRLTFEKQQDFTITFDQIARTPDAENKFPLYDTMQRVNRYVSERIARGEAIVFADKDDGTTEGWTPLDYMFFDMQRSFRGTPLENATLQEQRDFIVDMAKREVLPTIDPAAPEKALQVLSTGEVVAPLSLMLSPEAFDRAVASPVVPREQRKAMQAVREATLEATAQDTIEVFTKSPQGSSEFLRYMESQQALGKTRREIVDGWMRENDFSFGQTSLRGFARSWWEGAKTIALAAPALAGNEWALQKLIEGQEADANRRAYAAVMGTNLSTGWGRERITYDFATLVGPVLADLATTWGVGSAIKGTAGAAARTAVGTAVKTGLKNTMRTALTAETQGAISAFTKGAAARTRFLEAGAVTGKAARVEARAEATAAVAKMSADDVIKLAGRDISNKLATSMFYATSMAVGYNRSAGMTYASLNMALSDQKNPDGTPKYTQEEIREMSLSGALTAGTITAATMGVFMGVGMPGMEVIFRRGITNGQLTRLMGRLNKDVGSITGGVEAGGIRAAQDMLKNLAARAVTPFYRNAMVKGGLEEFGQEFSDEFLNTLNESRITGEPMSILEAIQHGLYGGMLGFGMGSSIAGVGTARRAATRPSIELEASIRSARLLDVAEKLQETSPQTAAVLRRYANTQATSLPEIQAAENRLSELRSERPRGERTQEMIDADIAEAQATADTIRQASFPQDEQTPDTQAEPTAAPDSQRTDTSQDVPEGTSEGGVEPTPSEPAVAEATPEPEVAPTPEPEVAPTPEPEVAPTRESIEQEFDALVGGTRAPVVGGTPPSGRPFTESPVAASLRGRGTVDVNETPPGGRQTGLSDEDSQQTATPVHAPNKPGDKFIGPSKDKPGHFIYERGGIRYRVADQAVIPESFKNLHGGKIRVVHLSKGESGDSLIGLFSVTKIEGWRKERVINDSDTQRERYTDADTLYSLRDYSAREIIFSAAQIFHDGGADIQIVEQGTAPSPDVTPVTRPDMSKDIRAFVERRGQEPPLREGFVRLYRGEDSDPSARTSSEMVGRFWSIYYSEATTYGDRIYYLDVPQGSLPNDMGGDSVLLAAKELDEIGASLLEPGYYDAPHEFFDAVEEQNWQRAAEIISADVTPVTQAETRREGENQPEMAPSASTTPRGKVQFEVQAQLQNKGEEVKQAVDKITARGADVVYARNRADAQKKFGLPNNGRKTTPIATAFIRSDGTMGVILFPAALRAKSGKLAETLGHELVHLVQYQFESTPEGAATAKQAENAFNPKHPDFDKDLNDLMAKEYPSWNRLSARSKVREAGRAAVEVASKGETSHFKKGIFSYLKSFLAHVQKVLSGDSALQQYVATVQKNLGIGPVDPDVSATTQPELPGTGQPEMAPSASTTPSTVEQLRASEASLDRRYSKAEKAKVIENYQRLHRDLPVQEDLHEYRVAGFVTRNSETGAMSLHVTSGQTSKGKAYVVDTSDVTSQYATTPSPTTTQPELPGTGQPEMAPKKVITETTLSGKTKSTREVTEDGVARVEAAKQRLRDIMNNEDIVGRQRADMIADGKNLIQFLDSHADTRKPLQVVYHNGDPVALTNEDAPTGFASAIVLEGSRAGRTIVVTEALAAEARPYDEVMAPPVSETEAPAPSASTQPELPGTEQPRRRSLSSMRDATVDRIVELENEGVDTTRHEQLLSRIEQVMMAEAQAARARAVAPDGTIRPSADPADIVAIAEGENSAVGSVGQTPQAPAQATPKAPKRPLSPEAKVRKERVEVLARKKALELAFGQNSSLGVIPRILDRDDKIQRPPVGLLRLIKKQKDYKNITEKQRAILEKWGAGYDSYVSKSQFGKDFNGLVAQALHDLLFSNAPTKTRLDDWAKGMDMDNDQVMREVMEELNRVARGQRSSEQQHYLDPNYEPSVEEEQKMMFDGVNQESGSNYDIEVSDLEVGQEIEVGGQIFTVVDKNDNEVTLIGPSEFGEQKLSLGDSIWIDADMSAYPSDVLEAMAKDMVDIAEEFGYEDIHDFAKDNPEAADAAVEGTTQEDSDPQSPEGTDAEGSSPADQPGGFSLETQTDEQRKAEEAAAKRKEKIREGVERRLTGSAGDLTSDMFGSTEGETPLFNQRRDVPPPTSDILTEIPEGYPLDRDAATLVAAAINSPGGLVNGMHANPEVAEAVRAYLADKGVDTTGLNNASLATLAESTLKADETIQGLSGTLPQEQAAPEVSPLEQSRQAAQEAIDALPDTGANRIKKADLNRALKEATTIEQMADIIAAASGGSIDFAPPVIKSASNKKTLDRYDADKGAEAFLKKVIRTGPKHLRSLAQALLDSGAANLQIRFLEMPNFYAAGFHATGQQSVHINLSHVGPRGPVDTLVHEMIHAVTDTAVRNPNAAQTPIIKRLDRVRNAVRKKLGDNMTDADKYATHNLSEFLTHFLTDPAFRDRVARMTPKAERNWVQVISDFIADLISYGRTRTQAERASDQLRKDMLSLFQSPVGGASTAQMLMQLPQRAQQVAIFNEFTQDLYQGRESATQEEIDAWREANPEKWETLSRMREEALREGGWTMLAWRGDMTAVTEYSDKTKSSGVLGSGIYVADTQRYADVFGKDKGGLTRAFFVKANSVDVSSPEVQSFIRQHQEKFAKRESELRADRDSYQRGTPEREAAAKTWGEFVEAAQAATIQEVLRRFQGDSIHAKGVGLFSMNTESEYALQNPSQIKSADPISPGPRITPDRWADTDSPDIRFQMPAGAPRMPQTPFGMSPADLLQKSIGTTPHRIKRLQQRIDAMYETGRTEGVEALEAELEVLLEQAETDIDGWAEIPDVDPDGAIAEMFDSDMAELDSANPSPGEFLVDAWYRWTNQGEINQTFSNAELVAEHGTFGNFVRSLTGDNAYTVQPNVTDAQIEAAAAEAVQDYERRVANFKAAAAQDIRFQQPVGGARVASDAALMASMLESRDFTGAQALADQGVQMDRATFTKTINPEATQRATTIHTRLESDGVLGNTDFADGQGLVYGDGKGMASRHFGAVSYEPFPPDGFSPDYAGDRAAGEGSPINRKFRTILNTFVLNVVDPQTRAFIVKDIANLLDVGGRAVIVTRGTDVANSNALVSFGPLERIQMSGGKLTYQKGFTQSELIGYVEGLLGEGFEVNPVKGGNAADVRIEVIKNTSAELNNPPIKVGSPDIRFQLPAEPTVTPEQDAAYMQAVEAGDMETAQRMVDEAARAAGYDVGPVEHGSDEIFQVFETGRPRSSERSVSKGQSIHFTTQPNMAASYGKNVRRFFLKGNFIATTPAGDQHPSFYDPRTLKFIDNESLGPNVTPGETPNADTVQALKRHGYSGIRVRWENGIEYAVFNPSQIKSADPVTYDANGNVIPLSQRFDATSPDIRFQLPAEPTVTPESFTFVEQEQGQTRRQFLSRLVGTLLASNGVVACSREQSPKAQISPLEGEVRDRLKQRFQITPQGMRVIEASARRKVTPSQVSIGQGARRMLKAAQDQYEVLSQTATDGRVKTNVYKDKTRQEFYSFNVDQAFDHYAERLNFIADNAKQINEELDGLVSIVSEITGVDVGTFGFVPLRNALLSNGWRVQNGMFLNAGVKAGETNIMVHPDTLADLTSSDAEAKLNAVATLANELAHVAQNQSGVEFIKDSYPLPEAVESIYTKWLESAYFVGAKEEVLQSESSTAWKSEMESFAVSWLAAKAYLMKNGMDIQQSPDLIMDDLANAETQQVIKHWDKLRRFYGMDALDLEKIASQIEHALYDVDPMQVVRFQQPALTEASFQPDAIRETAQGFLPDGVELDSLGIDLNEVAENVEDLAPVNAENYVRNVVNHAIAREAARDAINREMPVRENYENENDFDAAVQDFEADVDALVDIYERVTSGTLTEDRLAHFKANPNALQRLVDFLTEAIKSAYNRLTATYEPITAMEINRMSRELARAREGYSPSMESNELVDSVRFQLPPTDQQASPFYSKLERTIETKIPNNASPQQILSTLQSAGVKAEEIKWSGIEVKLSEMGPKVNKAELLEFLRNEGAVRFEEVAFGSESIADDAVRQEAYEDMKKMQTAIRGGSLPPNELSALDAWLRKEMSDRQLESAIEMDAADFMLEAKKRRRTGDTKFSQYTLPGGKNYREVVLAIPHTTKPQFVIAYKDGIGQLGGMTFDTRQQAEAEMADTFPRRTDLEIQTFYREKAVSEYTSTHFPDVPNYVAHMRLNERTDAQGNEGLFIEELQSDRHQAGREKGYVETTSEGEVPAGFRVTETEGGLHAVYRGTADGQGELVGSFRNRDMAVQEARNRANRGSIADAPHRKDWPLALFKRALRDAVSGGKNWIGWTDGVEQVRRYPAERDQGDKISHGMKGFYDNILPKEIGKYVKQWGAKVEKSSLEGSGQLSIVEDGDSFVVVGENNQVSGSYPTRAEAEARINELGGQRQGPPIWRIDITPEMRRSVETEGQVLFQLPAEALPEPTPQQIAALEEVTNAIVPKTGFMAYYDNDPMLLASADKPLSHNRFIRWYQERLINVYGALSTGSTKAKQNADAITRAAEETISSMVRKTQAALKDEAPDITIVQVAAGNTAPLLTPEAEARLKAELAEARAEAQEQVDEMFDGSILEALEDKDKEMVKELRAQKRETLNELYAAAEAENRAGIAKARQDEADLRREDQLKAMVYLQQNSPKTFEAVSEFRAYLNNLQRMAKDVNGDSPEIRMIIDQSLGIYLARSYQVHQDRNLNKLVRESTDPKFEQVRESAITYFMPLAREQVGMELENNADYMSKLSKLYDGDYSKMMEAFNRDVELHSSMRAQELFEDFMAGHDHSTEMFGSSGSTANEITRYMAKVNIPEELRAALVENTDPLFNMANTALSLTRLVVNAQLLNNVAKNNLDIGNYITEAEKASGITFAKGKEVMRRVFAEEGNDALKQGVKDRLRPMYLDAVAREFAADPSKTNPEQAEAKFDEAFEAFAETQMTFAELLPELGRNADRMVHDVFVGSTLMSPEVRNELQPTKGLFRNYVQVVPGNVKDTLYKPLHGLYASPEQAEALRAAFNIGRSQSRNAAQKSLESLNRFMLGGAGLSLGLMTLGSPGYYVRNYIGGLFMAGMQGVNPFNKDTYNYAKRFLNEVMLPNGEISPEFQELIAGRIAFDGAKLAYLKEIVDEVSQDPDKGIRRLLEITGQLEVESTKIAEAGSKGVGLVKALARKAARFAEASEVLPAVLTYADFMRILTEANFGTEAEIRQEASRLTKMVMPSKSERSAMVSAFAKSGPGAMLAPFLGFKVDMIRNTFNTPRVAWEFIKSDNPVLRKHGYKKMAAFTGVWGVITMLGPLIIRAMQGISDEEDRAVRAALPVYLKNASLFFQKDKKTGNIRIINLTYTNPLTYSADILSRSIDSLASRRFDEIPGNLARFVAEDFMGENIVFGNVVDALRNRNKTTQLPIFLESDPGAVRLYKRVEHIIGGSYVPRAISQPYRIYQATQRDTSNAPLLDTPLGQAFRMVAPFRPFVLTPADIERRAFNDLRRQNSELWQLTSPIFASSPISDNEIRKAYDRRLNAVARQNAKALDFVDGMVALRGGGASARNAVRQSMIDAGISKRRTDLLLNRKRFERVVFPDDVLNRLPADRRRVLMRHINSYPSLVPIEGR